MKRTCSIDGCERPHAGRSFCAAHYACWYRTGSPVAQPRASLQERFLARVEKRIGGCWLWTGSLYRNGYGKFCPEHGASLLAHRVSYEMYVGPIPERHTIDHKCHVLACVNPDHLQAVPQAVNSENRAGATAVSATGIRGVTPHKRSGKYAVTVTVRGKQHWGGLFADIAEAETAAIALRNRLITNNLTDSVA